MPIPNDGVKRAELETKYQNIVVVLTEDCDGDPAFERALTLAQAHSAALTVLDVTDPVPEESRILFSAEKLATIQAALDSARIAAIEPLRARAEESGVQVATRTVAGSAFRVAIRAVLENRHDLVVKSFDRRSDDAVTLRGSSDNHLLRKCPCPLWLVNPTEGPVSKRVLAAVNPDPTQPQDDALSVEIVRAAAMVSALDGSELHVLHAWRVFGEWLKGPPQPLQSDPEVDHVMGQALSRHAGLVANLMDRAAPAGRSARTHVVHARPANAIIDFVRKQGVDLLVIGTVARTGIPGLLIGSTAERVLSEVGCSVLALKPVGFVSPVTLDS